LVQSVFPEWTNFNQLNFGNVILELFAYVGDILNYYQDKQAAEAFWPTLSQRLSAIRHGVLFDFDLSTAEAAIGEVLITNPYPNATETATISIGHQFRSVDPENPQIYEATAEVTLPISGSSFSVAVEASESKEESFDSTDEPSQLIVLNYTPYLDGSIDAPVYDGSTLILGISAGDGDYSLADNFLGSTPSDKIFTISVDHQDRAHIRFGNGVLGSIPQGTITAKYKTGGGTTSDLEAGRTLETVDPILFSDGSVMTAVITNPEAITGGSARMSLTTAKEQAPALLATQERCVAKTDYETVAKTVSGIARTLMATSNEYPGIEENTGILYAVAQGSKLSSGRILPGTATSTMLAAIESEINTNYPPTITFSFSAAAAVTLPITVATTIYLESGADEDTVSAAITLALQDFFAVQLEDGVDNEAIDFGANLALTQGASGELAWSDVFNAIRDVTGVRKVDEGNAGLLLNGLRQSVELTGIEFPTLSTVTITNGDTGQTI
jgi:hypothetical protein